MKRRWCALLLALALPLSGCGSMLERSHASVSPHEVSLAAEEDPSTLEAENYQELVSAVLYLVTQHVPFGMVRLYNYTGDVEADLTAACLEVVQRDPLGAFAVDYIKHEVSRIVSYYEVTFSIAYQRTAEEVEQVVAVTGSSAIKSALRGSLSTFDKACLLRVSYLSEEEGYLQELIRQAYYDTPLSAFGALETELALYPESGIQRIVEVSLTYPESRTALLEKQRQLVDAVDALLPEEEPAPDARGLYDLLLGHVQLTDGPEAHTAYAALLDHRANQEGMALAYKLLCDRAGLTCTVVLGQTQDGPRCWNIVTTESGSRHVDCAAGLFGLTDLQLRQTGQREWDSSYPICRDGSEVTLELESE